MSQIVADAEIKEEFLYITIRNNQKLVVEKIWDLAPILLKRKP